MRGAETKEQRELRRVLRSFLAANASPDLVREASERGGFAAGAWSRIVSELELTATAIDADLGGVGGSFADVAVVLEELGRTLLPVPFLSTAVAASALGRCDSSHDRDAALRQILDGAPTALALAGDVVASDSEKGQIILSGEAHHVVGAEAGGLMLVAAGGDLPGLYGVQLDDPAVTCVPQATLDQTRPLVDVRLHGAEALGFGDRADVGHTLDLLRVALALESVGSAERALEETIDYLKQRVQFGRKIGSFQALKHRCAEMLVALERARATAAYGVWAVDEAPGELSVIAPMALALSSEAFMRIAAEAIQMRGGIGFTWDSDAHLYFKRAKSTQLLHGLPPLLRAESAKRAGVI